MILRTLFGVCLALFLVSCGSGGGGGGEGEGGVGTAASDNQQLLADYACDMSLAEVNAANTPYFVRDPLGYYTNSMTWDPLNQPGYDEYHEAWQVTIAGNPYFLNTLLVLPRVGRNGIIFLLHGLGQAQATMSIDSLRGPEETEYVKRGYAVVYIARRGSFGSSGAMTGNDEGYTTEDYTSQRISASEFDAANIRYQSASMVAALDLIYTDPRFRDHLHRMALMGGSGGAFTALYTAASSPVFKSATDQAVIRTTGSNSQNYLDSALGLASNRASESLYAPSTTTSTLWFAGALDPIANPGQLACGFTFYQMRSVNADQFYIVPGMDHGGFTDFWSPALYPIFSSYMRSRGFPNF